eukprot:TRINITY_DN56394_c0_g1_i1.p1 TRINITY_DN56394_c0_g1~~TRINITY_DN56394_c0_g1_i1.p1  ORF type:complete len:1294 (-),score=161.86 TRINITY_DN56394_c0_g1_i1:124-4005(-)
MPRRSKVEVPNAGLVPMERKLDCGYTRRYPQIGALGIYTIFLCVALAGGRDCSDISHETAAAGDSFEVAEAMGAEESASAGGGAQPPRILSSSGGAVVALAYAPLVPLPVSPDIGAPPAAEFALERLAVASEDGTIRLWEPSVPRLVAELVGHNARIGSLSWAPNGSWLASGGADGSVRLWGAVAGVAPGRDQDHPCPAWKPVWSRPADEASDSVWQDAIFGHLLRLLPVDALLEDRAFREDAILSSDLKDASTLTLRRAARQCEKICPVFREQATRRCDCGPAFECHHFSTCTPKCGLEMHIWEPAHPLRITAVGVSPDGLFVASASVDATIHIWNVEDVHRQSTGDLVPQPKQVLRSHVRAVLTLAFAPAVNSTIRETSREDVPVLASGGGDARVIWYGTEPNGTKAFFEVLRIEDAVGPLNEVLSAVFSADGRFFAAASARGGAIWDIASRVKVQDLRGFDGAAVAGLAMSSDLRWLALRGAASVQLWPLADAVAAATSIAANSGKQADQDPSTISGAWIPFGGVELGAMTLSWLTKPGIDGNHPRYSAKRTSTGEILELHFAPCDPANTSLAGGLGCSQRLPVVRVDIEAPFEFTAVRGSFVEYSTGPNGADDCRGGLPHSTWDHENHGREYVTLLGVGKSAEDKDCERIGPTGDAGRESLEACKDLCQASALCNAFNYRYRPPNCDLRRCVDVRSVKLRNSPDKVVHAIVRREELDEHLAPPHDGFVMFGAPDALGEGGVVYGGCGAGPDIPAEGVKIVLPEEGAQVAATRRLRWEVSQSRVGESLAVREIALELFRPDAGRRFLAARSGSPALAFALSRREFVAAVGDTTSGQFAVWDLTGFDVQSRSAEYQLKEVFHFDLQISTPSALQASDRMSVVDALDVTTCGDPYSAAATRKVQGTGDGSRADGNATYSLWTGMVATKPGKYRVCYCRGRTGALCDSDSDFATELMTFIVAGAEENHYFICEVTNAGETRECRLQPIRGIGLKAGDMIMVQDGPACGLADEPVPGVGQNGVAITREFQDNDWGDGKVYPAGTFYRFDHFAQRWVGVGQNRQQITENFVDAITTPKGLTAKLCWCAEIAKCDPAKPSDFRIDIGRLTIVRLLNQGLTLSCSAGMACKLEVDLLQNGPFSIGDVLLVKNSKIPYEGGIGRLEHCASASAIAGLGPNKDGLSARMVLNQDDDNVGVFDFGLAKPEALGEWRLCWCQGSIRPCEDSTEFSYDVGGAVIESEPFVWPACTERTVQFSSWRKWSTFDECCCNYHEAGAIGCRDRQSYTFDMCSKLPLR